MPNDEIVTKIEELKRICDPNESEATLVHELKQINDKIVSIQSRLSELKNIPDVIYYDDIQESRDNTRKAELNKQIIELQKEVSILEIELKDLKDKEAEQNNLLKELQQNKTKNVDTASEIRTYKESLSSAESKENMNTILTEVEKEVAEGTKAFGELEARYKELQGAIEEKASLINSKKEDINNYQKQLEQISTDLLNREKYINQEKKNENTVKIAELEKELESLTEQQAKIVGNPIMILSLANKAALDGDLVTILNKIKGVKESLLQKPFMNIPENSIQEQTAKAIEDRNTFYNQINGKDYTSKGLPAADERIDELNANIAKWLEEVNSLKARKDEIDNGTKYGSARKISEITETIKNLTEEVADFENKENITSDEEVALDKRKKEIAALKKVLDSYFADQNANIKEARCIEENTSILEERTAEAKEEIKKLRKMSKSLAGIDIMSKKKDSDTLQEYVNKVMDLKKLPEYRRMLGIVDEILDSLGKDIVVPTIEEKEEALVTREPEVQQVEVTKEEPIAEIHPIEDVKADEINIEPPLASAKEEIVDRASSEIKPETSNVVQEKTSGVVFEPAFKEPAAVDYTNALNGELKADINQSLNGTASKVVSSEEIKTQGAQEITNPFANISELKTVESKPLDDNIVSFPSPTPTSTVENQTGKVVEGPFKEAQSVSSVEPEKQEEVTAQEQSTNSIDDFFAQQWGEVSNDAPTLGKVA